MPIEILRHTPPWVWAVLALLVALGLAQLRPRDVPVWQPVVLPLALGGLGLSTLAPQLQAHPWSALPWLAGLAGSAALGWRIGAPAGAHWREPTRRLHRPGSASPLAAMLGVFALKYAAGVAVVLAPQAAARPAVVAGLALLSGVVAGYWGGRAAALLALVPRRRRGRTIAAHHVHRA